MLGSYGDIVFEVNDRRIRTFYNREYTKTANWGTAELIGLKPRSQFVAPGQDNFTFYIKLSDYLGLNAETELRKLETAMDKGSVASFIVGGTPQGARNARWYINELVRSNEIIDNFGRMTSVDVELRMKEYH